MTQFLFLLSGYLSEFSTTIGFNLKDEIEAEMPSGRLLVGGSLWGEEKTIKRAAEKQGIHAQKSNLGLIVLAHDINDFQDLTLPEMLQLWLQQKDGSFLDQLNKGIADSSSVLLFSLGVLVTEKTPPAELIAFQESWQQRFGVDAPVAIRLETVSRDAIVSAAVTAFEHTLNRHVNLNVRYARELAILRRQHEDMQAHFEKLEAFAFESHILHRRLSRVFSPSPDLDPVILVEAKRFHARLPDSSDGLSDFAFWIDKGTGRSSGILTVILSAMETDEILATWDVSSDRLTSGWNRFTLERALKADPVTLHVNVNWTGEGDLGLMPCVAISDDRFAVHGNSVSTGVAIAVKTWKYIPGAAAPLPAQGHVSRRVSGTIRRITGEHLKQAVSLQSLQVDLPFTEDSEALLLHVPETETRIAACYLQNIVDAEVKDIIIDVKTRHPEGPVVEYAAALATSRKRPDVVGQLPSFEAGHCSNWLRLQPDEDGQVHLLCPDILGEPHDLWFMVRLAPEVKKNRFRSLNLMRSREKAANAFGWSSISSATIRLKDKI